MKWQLTSHGSRTFNDLQYFHGCLDGFLDTRFCLYPPPNTFPDREIQRGTPASSFDMAVPQPSDFPWESRDKEVQAKISYDLPSRRENQVLADENLRLKRLLRENGIAWSPVAQAHIQRTNPTSRKTRAYTKAKQSTELKVPMEVLLRIVEFSLTSRHPIIDPLSPRKRENLTDPERVSLNQVAIHILATCKTLHVEGQRFLWERNSFTFTTPEAVRNFSKLDAGIRAKITHVNFRIIAQFWDDERRKFRHKLDQSYHSDLTRAHALRIAIRPKESPFNRGGFRCYTWSQVADFLTALGAPYVPKSPEKAPRPRLLPSLESLRIDLVNFTETLLPMPGSELHCVAHHELARTLNQLQITGVPCDDPGLKATAELIGIVKDRGLCLESAPTYVALNKGLQSLSDRPWCGRLVRPQMDHDGNTADLDGDFRAPKEKNYPETTRHDDETVLFKHVPVSRDSDRRTWIPFSLTSGYKVFYPDSDEETDDGFPDLCPCCGEAHPGSSFMWDEDYDEEDYFGL